MSKLICIIIFVFSPLFSQLEIITSYLNFGNVEIENSIHKQLIIYNPNPFSIQIDSINSSIESVYIDEYNNITIDDLDTIYIPISFQPHIEGPYDGYCYIYEENGIAHQIELIGWTSIVIENELTSLNDDSQIINFSNQSARSKQPPSGPDLSYFHFHQPRQTVSSHP